MAAVQQLCSRAIVLDDGRIVGDGDPSDMVRKHLDICLGSQNNSRDVTDRKRSGDHGKAVRFTRWELLDASGKPAPRLRFGEPITLDMSLHSTQSVQSVVFDLGIHTAEGTLLALVSTQQWPREITFSADQNFHARVRVDDLRLMPGSYCLSLAVRSVQTTLDHVPTAGAIEITPEFFHAGIGPTQHRSLVHTLPTWELNRPAPNTEQPSPPQSGTVILTPSAAAA
jgi:lipopolysaccharide transport system ATP-binding protein